MSEMCGVFDATFAKHLQPRGSNSVQEGSNTRQCSSDKRALHERSDGGGTRCVSVSVSFFGEGRCFSMFVATTIGEAKLRAVRRAQANKFSRSVCWQLTQSLCPRPVVHPRSQGVCARLEQQLGDRSLSANSDNTPTTPHQWLWEAQYVVRLNTAGASCALGEASWPTTSLPRTTSDPPASTTAVR